MIIESSIPEKQISKGSAARYFLEKLEETGTDIALIDCSSGETWNGHQAYDSILRCSSGLVEVIGIQKGDVVCVYAANSGIHSIAYLSIIAVGGIYAGCLPYNPLRELLNTIVDTETRYVICMPDNIDIAKEAIKECGREIGLLVFADDDIVDANGTTVAIAFNKLLKHESKLVSMDLKDEDIACLMMSSGSTGRPKPIIHSQKTLKNLSTQGIHDEVFGEVRGQDVLSGHIPFFHICGSLALLHSISSNVPIAIQPGFDTVKFVKYVDKYKISSAILVPTYLINIINCPIPNGCDLSPLVNVIMGGSQPPTSVVDRIQVTLPTLKLRQGYGLTEIGIVAIVHKSDSGATYSTSTIGKPVPGVRIKIIDPESKILQPVGAAGEICVSGNAVTPGYLNLPLVNEELFVDGTFFRTGDAGYIDEDGNVHIVARLKDIIKVEGVQVAPAELESLLMCHDDVLEAAVIGVSHEQYVEVPKAFVVLKNGRKCEEQTLIDFIKNQVNPVKQLRGGIVFVTDLPRSPIGKIQKSKLKLLELQDNNIQNI